MHDITKTRMLLTTAVCAAVAALVASGANARILSEVGSDIGAQPTGAATVDPLAQSWLIGQGLSPDEVTSWTVGACSDEVKASSCYAMFERTTARTRDQESGALSGHATTAKPATPGSTRYGYVVGGQLIEP